MQDILVNDCRFPLLLAHEGAREPPPRTEAEEALPAGTPSAVAAVMSALGNEHKT